MKEFGAEVIAVGTGFKGEFTHQTFPVNAVLRLPNETALTNFPGDARYTAIKKYRAAAYEELHLSVFHGRTPRARLIRLS